MSEPTPGPWERMGQSLVWAPSAKQVVAQVSEPEPDCGWVSFQEPSLGGPHHDTIIANARLIESAPDLLEMCKIALWRLKQYNYSAMQPTIEKLEAVIAKAETHK